MPVAWRVVWRLYGSNMAVVFWWYMDREAVKNPRLQKQSWINCLFCCDFYILTAECNTVFEDRLDASGAHFCIVLLVIDLMQGSIGKLLQSLCRGVGSGFQLDQDTWHVAVSGAEGNVVASLAGFPVGGDDIAIIHQGTQTQ